MKKLIILFAFVINIQAQSWTEITPQFDPPGDYVLYHTAIGDEDNLWFVDFYTGKIFHSSNGGYNWIMQRDSVKNAINYRWDIVFTNAQNGWVLASISDSSFILKTTNGGENWEKIETPHFHKIHFHDELSGIASGPAGIYKTVNGGTDWEKCVYDDEEIPNGIYGVEQITFFNEEKGWIILQPGNNWEGHCIIMESQDTGQVWQKKQTNISGLTSPVDIEIIDNQIQYAATGLNAIFFTLDGGITWGIRSTRGYNSILFCDSNRGWGTGGVGGGISFTTDGGISWHEELQGINVYSRFHTRSNIEKVFVIGFNRFIYVKDKTVGVDREKKSVLSPDFILHQNFPNPFNPSTTIKYYLPDASFVSIKVYDILGKEITTLVNENKSAGIQTIEFNASNFPSGVYIYTINANGLVQSKKMVLTK